MYNTVTLYTEGSNMICENCGNDHDGNYGSGRFCSSRCARGFSTSVKRNEINEKVSKKLKGRKSWNGMAFQKGYDPRRRAFTDAERKKAGETIRRKNLEFLKIENWLELSLAQKKSLILILQNNRCSECGLGSWQDKPITLELDHIDGDKENNIRDNLRCLCPNCHSQTPTFRARNIKNRRAYIDDISFKQALSNNVSVRAALIQLGLTPSAGNYARAYRLRNE
jgi:5-methylcytosine-specific restriction endonuclease McrA